MTINTKSKNDTTLQTPVQIANQSFDQQYQLSIVENAVYNPVTQTMDRMVQPGEVLPTSGLNPSLSATQVVDGNTTTITLVETIGTTNYTSTIVINNATGAVTCSAWT